MIEQLVNEINGLLRDGYPYSALGIALTLPDICGNIAYPNTKVADHYKKWYSEYVNPISALKFKDATPSEDERKALRKLIEEKCGYTFEELKEMKRKDPSFELDFDFLK